MFSVRVELEETGEEEAMGSSPLPWSEPVEEVSSGNPRVEEVKGVVRLYRSDRLGEEASSLVALLGVPPNWGLQELLFHLGSSRMDMHELRLLRHRPHGSKTQSEQRLALIRFYSLVGANDYLNRVHSEPRPTEASALRALSVHSAEFSVSSSPDPSSSTLAATATELPLCPVCLERLDQGISGMYTTLCNHVFHCDCLEQWHESLGCPVCRYVLSAAPTQDDKTLSCLSCGATEPLWMCLVCGNVACGRYAGGHAMAHHEESGHMFALDVDSQRVWDYANDRYVHRLIQSADGRKLVPLEDDRPVSGSDSLGESPMAAKRELLVEEYSALLMTQLDSQRVYWEGRLSALRSELEAQHSAALRGILGQQQRARSDEVAKWKARADAATAEANEARRQADFLRVVSDGIESNLSAAQQTIEARDKEIAELREQLRDVLMHLDTGEKLDDSLRNATVMASSTPKKSSKTLKTNRRR